MEKIEEQIEKLARSIAGQFALMEKHFEAVYDQIEDARMETKKDITDLSQRVSDGRVDIMDMRSEVRELRDMSIPLAEQDELRARMVRVEDHLGLPHEAPKAPAA